MIDWDDLEEDLLWEEVILLMEMEQEEEDYEDLLLESLALEEEAERLLRELRNSL